MSVKASRDVVLLLTHSADHFTVERVADALSRRGARPFRLDTNLFPRKVKLAAMPGDRGPQSAIEYEGTIITSDEVRAVWARRIWKPDFADELAPQFAEMCARESQAAMRGFLDTLHRARWVYDPRRDREAENKMLQLRIASEAGLRIPRTLMTNDPGRARAFFAEMRGAVVAKLLKPLSASMGQAPAFVYTSDVREEDLDGLESLRHSPMVFQERIEKERELRIAYVGASLFVGSVDSRLSSRGKTDWRLAGPDECAWQPDLVPDEAALRLRALMSALGLVYGAIDMIRTPQGEHVFLEVNPRGEWGMLERDLGHPISQALSDALLS